MAQKDPTAPATPPAAQAPEQPQPPAKAKPEQPPRTAKVGDKVLLHYMRTPGPTKATADGVIRKIDRETQAATVAYKARVQGQAVERTLEEVPRSSSGAFGYVLVD